MLTAKNSQNMDHRVGRCHIYIYSCHIYIYISLFFSPSLSLSLYLSISLYLYIYIYISLSLSFSLLSLFRTTLQYMHYFFNHVHISSIWQRLWEEYRYSLWCSSGTVKVPTWSQLMTHTHTLSPYCGQTKTITMGLVVSFSSPVSIDFPENWSRFGKRLLFFGLRIHHIMAGQALTTPQIICLWDAILTSTITSTLRAQSFELNTKTHVESISDFQPFTT